MTAVLERPQAVSLPEGIQPLPMDALIKGIPLKERIERIMSWNLDPVIYRVTTPDGSTPPQMSMAEAEYYTGLYRLYQIAVMRYPGLHLPPSLGIDVIWHCHILDTEAYMLDTGYGCGGYVTHFPYFGLRNPADAAALKQAYEQTQAIFFIDHEINLSGDDVPGGLLPGDCQSQRSCDPNGGGLTPDVGSSWPTTADLVSGDVSTEQYLAMQQKLLKDRPSLP